MTNTYENADVPQKVERIAIPQWSFYPDADNVRDMFLEATRIVLGCIVVDAGDLEIKVIQDKKCPNIAIALPNMKVEEYVISHSAHYIIEMNDSDKYGNRVAQCILFPDGTDAHLQLYLRNRILKRRVEKLE